MLSTTGVVETMVKSLMMMPSTPLRKRSRELPRVRRRPPRLKSPRRRLPL
jgi:hypothetical protein